MGKASAEALVAGGYFNSKPKSWDAFKSVIKSAAQAGAISEQVQTLVLSNYRNENMASLGYSGGCTSTPYACNEVFIVQSVDTAGYSDIPVLKTDFRNDGSLDPITFSDGTTGSVHNIRLYKIEDDVTGSGVVDYADLVFLNDQRLRTKIVNIGDWDMDATSSVTVAHGLTSTDIRTISVMIREDSPGLTVTPLNFDGAGTGDTVAGRFYVAGTNIELTRLTGGAFDTTSYNATSYNRGYITIQYLI